LSVTALGVMAHGILDLLVTLSVNGTRHNDTDTQNNETQYEDTQKSSITTLIVMDIVVSGDTQNKRHSIMTLSISIECHILSVAFSYCYAECHLY
jgi:hypothetical protein